MSWRDNIRDPELRGEALREDDELSDEEYLERYGEPRGAGADPAGRPDPRTHPEFWSE